MRIPLKSTGLSLAIVKLLRPTRDLEFSVTFTLRRYNMLMPSWVHLIGILSVSLSNLSSIIADCLIVLTSDYRSLAEALFVSTVFCLLKPLEGCFFFSGCVVCLLDRQQFLCLSVSPLFLVAQQRQIARTNDKNGTMLTKRTDFISPVHIYS